MIRLRVDWGLLESARVPDAIRAAVERRLAALWRFLDGSGTGSPPCRSEEFALDAGPWSLTYEVDLSLGVAVVRQVIHGV